MNHRISEAKKKWCPFVRISYGCAPCGDNRDYKCITDGCMAWVEAKELWIDPQKVMCDQIQGRCGLIKCVE